MIGIPMDPMEHAARVKRLREAGLGFIEAKRQIDREYIMKALADAGTLEEMRVVLRVIAEKVL